jgi:putative thioredoxin
MAHVEFKEENQDFNKVIEEHKEKSTFVDFFADWCPPCRMLKPMLEKACQENGFNFISINVDQNPNISEEYNVRGIPYVVLFIKGKKVLDFTGANIPKFQEAVERAKKGE